MTIDCFACSTDRCQQCPALHEPADAIDPDEDGFYTVECCCGRWGETLQTLEAEYAEMNQPLKPLQWPDYPQEKGSP